MRPLLSLLLLVMFYIPARSTLISAQAMPNQWTASAAAWPGILVALDRNLYTNFNIGLGIGIIGNEELYIGHQGNTVFERGDYFGEIHGMYRFLKESPDVPMDMGIILGAYMDKIALKGQIGLGIDIYMSEQFTGRLNLTAGPRFGVEIGYLSSEKLEFNLAVGNASAFVGVTIFNLNPRSKKPQSPF